MNKTVVVEYTEEDRRLLSRVTSCPEDPCINCCERTSGACMGCPNQRAYDKFWEPYRDANIEEVGKNLLKRERIKVAIKDAEEEIARINSLLPDFVGGDNKTNLSGVSVFLKMAEGK